MKKSIRRTLTASLIITTIGCSYLLWAAPAITNKLRLHLTVQNTSIRPDEYISANISITNDGNRPVTLVKPGDGSESGWRTPVIKWIVTQIRNDSEERSTPESKEPISRCGNINSLSFDEVFILHPGKTREFTDWIDNPGLRKPGVYKLAFSYENNPSVEWQGVPLGLHNPIAMLWAKNSTRCKLESNEIIIEIRGE
jgi:hypothetical protein